MENQIKLKEEGEYIQKEFLKIQQEILSLLQFDIFKIKENLKSTFSANPQNASKQLNFYHYYPFLFYEEFLQIPLEHFRQIALAGILYFEHLLIEDRILDNNELHPVALLYNQKMSEKTIMFLSVLFPDSSPFWNYFDQCKKQFYAAIALEKVKHVKFLAPYPQEEFIKIAQGKSAIAKTSTAALAVLAQKEEKISILGSSQDLFHTAYQLYDDLTDWREDYRSSNFSYLLTKVIEKHPLKEEILKDKEKFEESVGRAMYFSGQAEENLTLAETFAEKAIEVLENCQCPRWIEHIKQLQKSINVLRIDLGNIKGKILAQEEMDGKNYPINQEKPGILSAIKSGVAFIQKQQNADGHWEDFSLNIGPATECITAYIGKILFPLFGWGFKEVNLKTTLEKAASWLVNSRANREGWGWHKELCYDADDTAMAILFLHNFKKLNPEDNLAYINLLLANQNSDGGIGTYNYPTIEQKLNKDNPYFAKLPKEDYQGWCASDPYITAVSLLALLALGVDPKEERISKAIEYILQTQEPEGYWNSYWHQGRIVGTIYAIRLLKTFETGEDAVKKAMQYLKKQQLPNGSFNNGVGNGTVVDTALAIYTLLSLGKQGEIIDKAINWLLTYQLDDGSWPSSKILVVPQPQETKPWKNKEMSGVPDHNRLYTTAAVVRTLAYFYYLTKHNQLKQTNKKSVSEVFTLYKDFNKFFANVNGQNLEEQKANCLKNYILPNKEFFAAFFNTFNLQEEEAIKRICALDPHKYQEFQTKLTKVDLTALTCSSLKKCYKVLPEVEKLSIYLLIGPRIANGFWLFLNNKPIIGIGLEHWINDNRISELTLDLPRVIAHETCHIAQVNYQKLSPTPFCRLYQEGLAVYFSNLVYPDIPLANHLAMSQNHLQWCEKNEWFLKRVLKQELLSQDPAFIRLFFDAGSSKFHWLPPRSGYFIGYRMIEDYLTKNRRTNFQHLLLTPPEEFYQKISYFNRITG